MSEEQTTAPGVTSRRVLLAGAGAIGAGVVVAGCGGDSTDGNGAGDGATGATSATPGTGDDSAHLARTGDVPVGGGVVLASQGVLVTQPTAGAFRAFSAVCTHQSCPIAGIDGGSITCTCHGSSFSIEDGSVRTGPATKPLPAKEITVDGDSIRLA